MVKHEGLLFASGWYVNADEFTQAMVATAAHVFRQVGLEGTIAYFASPETDFAGLWAVIGYYNSAANVEGEWFAFIADENGTVIDHYDKALVGTDIKDLLGTDSVRGHRGGQLGDHGGRARLGGRPGRDDLRFGLAQRPRRDGRLRLRGRFRRPCMHGD